MNSSTADCGYKRGNMTEKCTYILFEKEIGDDESIRTPPWPPQIRDIIARQHMQFRHGVNWL